MALQRVNLFGNRYGRIAEVWFDGANGEGPNGKKQIYDWPRFFVRLAFDPKVNFTPENMWRLSVGTRF